MFHSARLKLTAWYVLIIMIVSIAFSVFIYIGAAREFDRILRMQQLRIQHPDFHVQVLKGNQLYFSSPAPAPDIEVIEEAKTRTLLGLIGINSIVLVLSSLLGYVLAGRTLRPIQKMVDEQHRFITDASHELRTPLTSLRTEIEVGLRNKKITTKEAVILLESNLEEVIALQGLSDNLLELAQNGSLIKPKDMQTVSLHEIVHTAVKKVESLAKAKSITLEEKTRSSMVRGVQDRLTEAFVILLDNAIKYSPKKSTVLIKSREAGNEMVIEVVDHGSGIAKEDIPYIFDRFFRANKSRSKEDVSGYGLGLAIAKKIIESHKGKITALSNEGKGTTFRVLLVKV